MWVVRFSQGGGVETLHATSLRITFYSLKNVSSCQFAGLLII